MDRLQVNQDWLAEQTGKSQSTVSGWVNGATPHKKTIIRIAGAFKVDPECLLDDSMDLPPWEPADKVKATYPPEFTQRLKGIRADTEEYIATEGDFRNTVIKQLLLIEKKLDLLAEKQ